MNIVIVGFDLNLINEISRDLAKALKYNYKNSEALIRKALIKTIDFPLNRSNKQMDKTEAQVLKDLSDLKDTVISASLNSFIGNDNYQMFNNSYTLLIKKETEDKTLNSIQKLVSRKVKMVIEENAASIEKIKKIIF